MQKGRQSKSGGKEEVWQVPRGCYAFQNTFSDSSEA